MSHTPLHSEGFPLYAAFQIFRESTNNVIEHADNRPATVYLRWGEGAIVFRVNDDTAIVPIGEESL